MGLVQTKFSSLPVTVPPLGKVKEQGFSPTPRQLLYTGFGTHTIGQVAFRCHKQGFHKDPWKGSVAWPSFSSWVSLGRVYLCPRTGISKSCSWKMSQERSDVAALASRCSLCCWAALCHGEEKAPLGSFLLLLPGKQIPVWNRALLLSFLPLVSPPLSITPAVSSFENSPLLPMGPALKNKGRRGGRRGGRRKRKKKLHCLVKGNK